MTLLRAHSTAPVASEHIARLEFLELTGIGEDELLELIRMEWITPVVTAQDDVLFLRRDVHRVRKYVRLCSDFELSPIAGTIIVDLLHRIEALERRVEELRRLATL